MSSLLWIFLFPLLFLLAFRMSYITLGQMTQDFTESQQL